MEIWIFNHYSVGPGKSGITRHTDLAKYLVRDGHKVKIFASSFNHQTRSEDFIFDNDKYKEQVIDGIEYVWIKTRPYKGNDIRRIHNMISYYKNAKYAAKKMNTNPDIVIGSMMHHLAAYLGYKVAKQRNAKFIFEERDLWPQTIIDFGKISKNNPISTILYRFEKFMYKKSYKTIVLFDNAKSYVVSKGISKDKVICIPNAIDPERAKVIDMNLPHDLSNYFEERIDKKIIVYTGTHGLANNLDAILDAAKETEKLEFLFVGDGPKREELIKRKKTEKIENVTFLKSVDKAFIPSILSKCDLGLLPLKNSPVFKWGISPNKLFDYMGNSLPVVLLCDIDDSPLQKANAGFVIKDNFSKELAQLLLNLDFNNLDQLGVNGKEYVYKNHNWEINAKKILS